MRVRLLLLCYVYALKAQDRITAVIQVPASLKVENGSTIHLQCLLDVVGTRCYTVVWTKIDPRTKMLTFPKNSKTGTNDDGSEKICPFTIENASVDESGIYYCSVVLGSITFFGSGSTVIVTPANRTALPPVDIFWPHSIQSRVPLLCVVSGVVPSEVRVFWIIDGEEESGLTQSHWTNDSDQGIVESTQNQVVVHAEKWETGALCTCVVEFGRKNISKSVQIQSQGNRDVCVALVYGAFAGAGLIVAICIALFLNQGRSVKSNAGAREQRRTTDLERRLPSRVQGRGSPIDPTISEVLYVSLAEASSTRRT